MSPASWSTASLPGTPALRHWRSSTPSSAVPTPTNAGLATRSLLYVEDAVAHRGTMPPGSLDSAPPAPRVTGLEFVELGVLEQHPLTAPRSRHWASGTPGTTARSRSSCGNRARRRSCSTRRRWAAAANSARTSRRSPWRRPTRSRHLSVAPTCMRRARARPRPEGRRRHRDRGPRRHRGILQPVGRTPRALGRSLRPGLRRVRRAERPRPAHRRREPGPALRQLRGSGAVLQVRAGAGDARGHRDPRDLRVVPFARGEQPRPVGAGHHHRRPARRRGRRHRR